ncbi:hypothetical protein LV82_02146 [Albidovulum inexpectatum]|uniref:EamA-like transporter family protein n=1 Tax=Albidovulum inexpectatum TaxID=196587 RepID=A0A2S5JFV0_9RHOB|nr:DMT family transporter [Albidovulum inexpectatum]PPB80271.1 hypothetical protein LV82_02146 [Albidovulum inexpectatum]
MTTLVTVATKNRTLVAACLVLGFAAIIGLTDNLVRPLAAEIGLWQFHAMRSMFALALLGLGAPLLGLNLRPVRPGAVALRSLLLGGAIMIYFASLAFMPVAGAAAGLFTAPIFTLLIVRFCFGVPIGRFRIAAVIVGFAGVLLVLNPSPGRTGMIALMPVVAGILYALGNIATRRWCEGETPEALLMGFFIALGVMGAVGMVVMAILQPSVPQGPAGFVLRPLVALSPSILAQILFQAVGALAGVALLTRAYQIAEVSRVAIFEYALLPMAAAWSWVLWGQSASAAELAGMVLIVVSGLIIALRGR